MGYALQKKLMRDSILLKTQKSADHSFCLQQLNRAGQRAQSIVATSGSMPDRL
jgi:hypothetical protein